MRPVWWTGLVCRFGEAGLVYSKGSFTGLRPSIKHKDKVQNWSTPVNRAELDTFF